MNYNIKIITEKSVVTISKKKETRHFSIIIKMYAKSRFEFKKLYVIHLMAQKRTIIGGAFNSGPLKTFPTH